MRNDPLDQLAIDTIRTLSIDAVQKASSGHPGTPMDAAPTAYCLWQRFLRYDPAEPLWPNRDRFVLSAGHASMLLYSILHLARVRAVGSAYEKAGGPAVSLDDIKTFRQAGSRCPGHPEHHWTTGVEASTGPLGQGVAMSVGMAIASCWLGATFNRPNLTLFDFDVYAFCSDGDLMEGISGEAASIAGHLALSNLCWIYDNNRVTIEGPTSLAFTEDVAARFQGYGWDVTRVGDANDLELLTRAYQHFLEVHDRPTLIIVDSHIGYGAPHRQDTKEAHGEPLGADEVRLAKQFYGWDPDASFVVPPGVMDHFDAELGRRGARARGEWQARLDRYRAEYPDLAANLDRLERRELPDGWDASLPGFPADPKGLATRDASGKVLNALAERIPWLLGGAADLWPSTKTRLTFSGAGEFESPAHDGSYGGRNFHFGIREHAMAAIVNGLALSGLRSFGSSFLVFTDYCRGALRLSALMELPVLYVFTHDSISLGEDGPTHQPIEHLASLRAMPGMLVIRPADANEVTEAYRVILRLTDRPTCLVLSRQALPTIDRTSYRSAAGLARGAYVVADPADGKPDVLLLATGSEVSLCLGALPELERDGIKARVVSMPCWELFDEQDPAYRDEVLPPAVTARVAVEQASPFGWDRFVGTHGTVLAMRSFGLSAPMKVVAEHFGFTAAKVAAAARAQVGRVRVPG
jgi:transketolase